MGLGDGRLRTSMFPWMREFERTVLLVEGVVEEIDDDERLDLLVVLIFFSYMSLKLRELYLLVLAIHYHRPPPLDHRRHTEKWRVG